MIKNNLNNKNNNNKKNKKLNQLIKKLNKKKKELLQKMLIYKKKLLIINQKKNQKKNNKKQKEYPQNLIHKINTQELELEKNKKNKVVEEEIGVLLKMIFVKMHKILKLIKIFTKEFNIKNQKKKKKKN